MTFRDYRLTVSLRLPAHIDPDRFGLQLREALDQLEAALHPESSHHQRQAAAISLEGLLTQPGAPETGPQPWITPPAPEQPA